MVQKNKKTTSKERKIEVAKLKDELNKSVTNDQTQKAPDMKNFIIIFLLGMVLYLLFSTPDKIIVDATNTTPLITEEILNKTIVEEKVDTSTGYELEFFKVDSVPFLFSPIIDLMIFSFISSLFLTLFNKKFTDQKKLKKNKKEMKELQTKLREMIKTNPNGAKTLQAEMMKKNFENLKELFKLKNFLLTAIPIIFFLTFLNTNYVEFGILLTFLWDWGWFSVYIVSSLVSSIFLRKVMDVA